MRGYDPAWYAKMMHRIPPASVEDRVRYILAQCQGKRVLHLGCNWPPGSLHRAIEKVAEKLYGIDISIPVGQGRECYVHADLDSEMHSRGLALSLLGQHIDIVVCAEILEHLGNPGNLLLHLKKFDCPVLITVPNAFSNAGYYHVSGGTESVNPEHVAYYSYHTLRVLIERYGYVLDDWYWYNGKPGTAEGLIFLVH